MKNLLFQVLVCSVCNRNLRIYKTSLKCSRGHVFRIVDGVPVMVQLNNYLKVEAMAWEDKWSQNIPRNSLRAYEKNMEIFGQLGYWEESGVAARLIPSKKNSVVLDLGCGNGVSTANIKGKFVVGLDLSINQLAKAKKNFPTRDFVVADARQLPFMKETFDLIVAVNVLHHVTNPEVVLKECHRVLKRGGVLLTVDPNLYNPFGYASRSLFRVFKLKKVFPTFPQFALGEYEYQFTKSAYYKLFKLSPFKNFKIKPHRAERVLFLGSIIFPWIAQLPFYKPLLIFVSKVGDWLVQYRPFDNLCYFWLGEVHKDE